MLVGIHRRISNGSALIAKYVRQRYSNVAIENSANAATPEYPPILDLSFHAKKARKEKEWHDKIKSVSTVEEKLLELNMPRYYGWKSVILEENCVRYDTLDFAQCVTRTHIIRDSALPRSYDDDPITSEQLENTVNEISRQIQDNIVFENCNHRQKTGGSGDVSISGREEKDILVRSIVGGINRTILINLSPKYPHLLQAQVEQCPRVEAFWFAGGMEPPTSVRKSREGLSWCKEYLDDPVDRAIQYFGSPILHLRHDLPLGEFVSLSESENPEFSIPEFKLDPRTVGYCAKRKPATNIPGFWPGDPCEFGLLSYHSVGDFVEWPKGRDDFHEALTAQAILASYAWLLAQACYQGFSTFNDLTYPLTTQTIITDGQWWSFCAYQLNTTLIHGKHATANPRSNLCWITKPTKLYDTVETESGKIHGFDDNVLRNLLKFYVNVPREKTGVQMKPHLGESIKVIADIPEDERRTWLEKNYKHLVSGRPRHRRIPEIYHWQKIYMIDHKTRPMDKRRDFWQFGIDPFKRRLDDHTPRYIPRKLREHPNKRKIGRWEKTFYP